MTGGPIAFVSTPENQVLGSREGESSEGSSGERVRFQNPISIEIYFLSETLTGFNPLLGQIVKNLLQAIKTVKRVLAHLKLHTVRLRKHCNKYDDILVG